MNESKKETINFIEVKQLQQNTIQEKEYQQLHISWRIESIHGCCTNFLFFSYSQCAIFELCFSQEKKQKFLTDVIQAISF